MIDALVVVDMQNLFVDAVGDAGPRVLDTVNALVAEAVAAGRPVLYTRDYAPIAMPDGDPRGDLHPKLDVRGEVLAKGPGREGNFSGFLLAPQDGPGSGGLGPLAAALRTSGADTVTVVGIAADVCVAATAVDAVRLGYPATIPLPGTAFVRPGPDLAVAELRAAGVTVLDS